MRSRNYHAGAILWALSVQYYLAQLAVAAGWPANNTYSWANNTISDLGNTRCGEYGARLVCSPGHTLMNLSFTVLGITMAAGSVFLWSHLGISRLARLGLGCMAIAGIGTVLVGMFPENTVSSLHILGAALPFILGNAGMIMIGTAVKKLPVAVRIFSVAFGLLGLAGLSLFMTKTYLGLGIGGMERVTAYPQSIWMIVLGIYLLITASVRGGTKR